MIVLDGWVGGWRKEGKKEGIKLTKKNSCSSAVLPASPTRGGLADEGK